MMQLYGGLDHTTGQCSPDSETPQWNLGGKLFSEIRHKRNGIQMERQGEAHQDERNSKNSRKSRKQVVASEVGKHDRKKLKTEEATLPKDKGRLTGEREQS